MPSATHSRRRKASGTWTRMPAPSPVSGSQLHALGVRREDDHGLGPRHAIERADLADEALERRGVLGLHLEEQRVLAGHVVALEYVAERGHLALEVADPARVGDQHPDEGSDVEAEPARVQDGAVTGDDARGLELLDALEHGQGAEPYLLADADERRPA